MRYYIHYLILLLIVACKQDPKPEKEKVVLWTPYNDSTEVADNQDHEIARMRYKLIQSKVLDKNEVFGPLYKEVSRMSDGDYMALRPLILEQDIPTIRAYIESGMLTYEKLVLFYLYRIYKYELDNTTTLNTVIALNASVVEEARKLDRLRARFPSQKQHPIYGMPILLKDNINTLGMKTTAGSIALVNNEVNDAFIVKQLKLNGALILGKVNLSEWAYYLCQGCPVGYSAVGGQTLNPYGRRIFETGGSSSGSGTAVAANYAVAAVGTETSGSILSPSGQNSVVGLKPTIGLLGRSGIVPISSTLDTPGPMTKNVTDNAILLSAMTGRDEADSKSVATDKTFINELGEEVSLEGKRLGAMKNLMEGNPMYRATIEKLRESGAKVVEFDPLEIQLKAFLSILNIDMRNDLPEYLTLHSDKDRVPISSVADVVQFNATDSLVRIPYGQQLFRGILSDTTSAAELTRIKSRLEQEGRRFFDAALDEYDLDAVLSINNYHAGYAAVAKYPALTVPMGYKETGEPMNLTFIAKPFQEEKLLLLGRAFEQATQVRKIPVGMAN
ncbi:amidase [Flavobacteriaceae bacterium TP-CH-4]|uniref:Amidase n=1 Tax=Pelagihabitans pacificus TaxID=2696054 RepID=A0A967ASE5_9FLAO|nr:amidase family protein [Pelagihabitans pacificus]NHF58063.1 amidase [Pelagihabitans pacificus]